MNNSSPEPNHRGSKRPVDKSLSAQLEELARAGRELRAELVSILRLRQIATAASSRLDMVALVLLLVAIAAGIALILTI